MDSIENKENTDWINKMRNYKDPLLEAFDAEQKKAQEKDSDDESSGSEEETSEEELSDIKFPRDDAAELIQFITRDLNNLQNKDDKQKRKFSLLRLYEIFVIARNKAPNKIY